MRECGASKEAKLLSSCSDRSRSAFRCSTRSVRRPAILLTADSPDYVDNAHSRYTCSRRSHCSGWPTCPDLIGRRTHARHLLLLPCVVDGDPSRMTCASSLRHQPARTHNCLALLLACNPERSDSRALRTKGERQLCAWRLSWHCAPDHREGLGGGGQSKVFGDRERERETTQSTDGWKQRLRRTKMGITGLGDIGEAESREKESVCAGLRRQRRVGPCSKPTL